MGVLDGAVPQSIRLRRYQGRERARVDDWVGGVYIPPRGDTSPGSRERTLDKRGFSATCDNFSANFSVHCIGPTFS